MRKLPLLVFILSLACTSLSATEYFFTSIQDHYYENPANWSPAYPGTIIGAEDKVTILDDIHFIGFNIILEGTMEIGLAVEVNSSEGSILIGPKGTLDNSGSIKVRQIINQGNLFNRFCSLIHIFDYHAKQGAYTQNAVSAVFVTISDLKNEGQFDNYSYCRIGNNLINYAFFHQIKSSKLDVNGNLLQKQGSIITLSRKCTVHQRATPLVMVDGILSKKK